MPWVLLLVGVLICLYAADIRDERTTTSKVTVDSSATSKKHDKVTTTEAVPSDTLLATLIAVASLTLLAGAFYSRVSKIGLPGGSSIELVSGDAASVAAAVTERVVEAVGQEPSDGPPDPAAVAEVAAKAATAATLAQQEALLLRVAAARGARGSGATPLRPREIRRLNSGMPLSQETVDSLAASVVDEVFGDDQEKPAKDR